MENITISYITINSPKYKQVWELREEVLRKPLGLSLKNEDLSWDNNDVMFIAEHNGKVIGCLMLHEVAGGDIKLRQMAVYNNWQGKGIGRMLVNSAEKFCAEKGYCRIVLHARKEALGFYNALGYAAHGDEFSEVGIPHFAMVKPVDMG